MKTLKQQIPNTITLGNLFCGCLALLKAFEGDLVWAAYLIGIAAVLDFFDGLVARLLNVSSAIGKDLDSLADLVSFGLVPGMVLYKMIKMSLFLSKEGFPILEQYNLLCYAPLMVPVFSAVRLAKFNNDLRQKEEFIGLPTPANAILILSIPLMVHWHKTFSFEEYNQYKYILNPYLLLISSCLLSFLLVSPIVLFALKFKNFKFKGNEIRYVFLISSILLISLLQLRGIPIVIVLYLVLSIIHNLLTKPKAGLQNKQN